MKYVRVVERLSGRVFLITVVSLAGWSCRADDGGSSKPKEYRGLLGTASSKVKVEDGKTWLWAGGVPTELDAQWYDFTGAAIPAAELQFGIGKDRIKAIDDPLFVSPEDPRLAELAPTKRGDRKKPVANDELEVIGFVEGQHARAYPVALLDHHELVNDSLNGKPVAVGW